MVFDLHRGIAIVKEESVTTLLIVAPPGGYVKHDDRLRFRTARVLIVGALFRRSGDAGGIRGIHCNGPLGKFRQRDAGLCIGVRPVMSHPPLDTVRRYESFKTNIERCPFEFIFMRDISDIPTSPERDHIHN
jgi:hypothetical protein